MLIPCADRRVTAVERVDMRVIPLSTPHFGFDGRGPSLDRWVYADRLLLPESEAGFGQMMEPCDTLIRFLQRTLQSRWRARYIDLVSRATAQGKFLSSLHHELLDRFAPEHIVRSLPEAAWSCPAFSFSTAGGFGVAEESLRDAHNRSDDAILVITKDGGFGYHREEDRIDTEILISFE
jgi:hypothetical protein